MADPSGCSLVDWRAVREAVADSRHDGVSAPDLAIRAARLTRAQFGGHNDTARLPAWDSMGVFVRQAPISASGMLVSQDMPIRVWVRDGENRGRQRYTVAHELAHFLIDPSWFAGAELENACDTFAADLLVPRRVARARLGASGTVGPDDVLSLTGHLQLNLKPIMRQFATVSWHPAFVTLYVMPDGRVKSGAGTSIGAPFPDKRITTLGHWYCDPDRGQVPGHTAGAATLEYRFGPTFHGNANSADKPYRSGAVRGTAEWAATELPSGASIMALQFTDFTVDYSQPRA
jgi:hypothetical protein